MGMDHNHAKTNAIVALEALFAGIGVSLHELVYHLGADGDGIACLQVPIVGDQDDDIDQQCMIPVDLHFDDFLSGCSDLDDDYVTQLALLTAVANANKVHSED